VGAGLATTTLYTASRATYDGWDGTAVHPPRETGIFPAGVADLAYFAVFSGARPGVSQFQAQIVDADGAVVARSSPRTVHHVAAWWMDSLGHYPAFAPGNYRLELLSDGVIVGSAGFSVAGADRFAPPAVRRLAENLQIGPARRLTQDGVSQLIGWSYDGRQLLFTDPPLPWGQDSSLWRMDADGLNRRLVVADASDATFSRDDQAILYTSSPYTGVYRVEVGAGTPHRLVDDSYAVISPQFDSFNDQPSLAASLLLDGRLALRQGQQLVAVSADGVVSALGMLPPGYDPMAISPTGHRVVANQGARVWLIDLQGTSPPILLADHGIEQASWSPDGSHLAYGTTTLDGPSWISDALGGHRRLLTTAQLEYLGSFNWSPDGRMLAFSRVGKGSDLAVRSRVQVVNVDGTGLHRIDGPASDVQRASGSLAPLWSPDGQSIGVTRYAYAENPSDIWILPLTPRP
jgi:Tol biopolymer transport system component